MTTYVGEGDNVIPSLTMAEYFTPATVTSTQSPSRLGFCSPSLSAAAADAPSADAPSADAHPVFACRSCSLDDVTSRSSRRLSTLDRSPTSEEHRRARSSLLSTSSVPTGRQRMLLGTANPCRTATMCVSRLPMETTRPLSLAVQNSAENADGRTETDRACQMVIYDDD